jgi:glycosyltransferase involved in cell wall biosynthesis
VADQSHPPVLIYRNSLLPTSETFIRGQALALKRHEAYFAGIERIPGLELPPGRTVVAGENGLLARLTRALLHRFPFFPAGMTDRLRTLSPRLVHAHFAFDAWWGLRIADALKKPLLVTLHGYDVTATDASFRQCADFALRRFPRRRAEVFARATHFVAVSEFVRKAAIEKGCPQERITVLYTGIDCEAFRPGPAQRKSPMVLFVGRLVPVKGCEYLLRAMSAVQREIPDAELVIVGDGPLRLALEALAQERLRAYRFVGMQSPEVVRRLLDTAAVFCVPSIQAPNGATEGFGMVFLEAQAMGVPVVSFRSGGIEEAVADGSTGILVPPGDDAALAAGLLRLLNDEELRSRMGMAGRERVQSRFDLARANEALECLYDRVSDDERVEYRK